MTKYAIIPMKSGRKRMSHFIFHSSYSACNEATKFASLIHDVAAVKLTNLLICLCCEPVTPQAAPAG